MRLNIDEIDLHETNTSAIMRMSTLENIYCINVSEFEMAVGMAKVRFTSMLKVLCLKTEIHRYSEG